MLARVRRAVECRAPSAGSRISKTSNPKGVQHTHETLLAEVRDIGPVDTGGYLTTRVQFDLKLTAFQTLRQRCAGSSRKSSAPFRSPRRPSTPWTTAPKT